MIFHIQNTYQEITTTKMDDHMVQISLHFNQGSVRLRPIEKIQKFKN